MSENNGSSVVPVLLTFLAGAAMGAIVVALTTPKSGPRLRKELKDLVTDGEDKVHEDAERLTGAKRPVKKAAGPAPSESKRGRKVSVDDLPG
jgi:gas vesicle protein